MQIKKLPGSFGLSLLCLVICITIVAYVITKNSFSYQTVTVSATYTEYRFDSGKDTDLGFTKRALARLEETETLSHESSTPTTNIVSMLATSPTQDERGKGVLQKWSHDADIYHLQKNTNDAFSIFKNQTLLFIEPMYFGADGPILDARVIDGRPVFTYLVTCENTCQTDIYDQGRVSEKYNQENPRYLFSYEGKTGFIASDDGMDKVFFDGQFITPAFDMIQTHNCCASQEMLPTVYTNGTLLFYGQRDGENYLAEVSLINVK